MTASQINPHKSPHATPSLPNHQHSEPTEDMAARKADEADLSDNSEERSAPRPKTGKDDTTSTPTPPTDIQEKDLDVIHYLRTPYPNPLDVQGWDNAATLENLIPAQEAKWKAVSEAKLLVYKAYGGKIEDKEDVTKI